VKHKVVTLLRIVQFTQLLSRNTCVCHKLFIYNSIVWLCVKIKFVQYLRPTTKRWWKSCLKPN